MSDTPIRPHVIRFIEGRPVIDDQDPWRLDESAGDHGRELAPFTLIRASHLKAWPGHPPAPTTPIGALLEPADDPGLLQDWLTRLAIIAVHFPKFTDGRGYSSAYLLRQRLGWKGQLRAVGDILQDQLFALRRVGFDSFALRGDRDPHAATQGFSVFSSSYQGSVDNPLPAFRRERAGL